MQSLSEHEQHDDYVRDDSNSNRANLKLCLALACRQLGYLESTVVQDRDRLDELLYWGDCPCPYRPVALNVPSTQ